MKKLIDLIYCKIESYFCWHGWYSKWQNGIYGEFYESSSTCWICNTKRGNLYMYFYEKFEYLSEAR